MEHRGVVSSMRQPPSRGARVARCPATVENGGVGATWSTWLTCVPGRDGGLVISGWVQHGEAVGAVLTGGVGSTVRPIQFSNRIKLISNGFKFAPKFDRSKSAFPCSKNSK
jgi:hypothetical protein